MAHEGRGDSHVTVDSGGPPTAQCTPVTQRPPHPTFLYLYHLLETMTAIYAEIMDRCTAAKAGMTSVSVPLSTATQSRTNFHKQFFTSGCSCQALSNG